MKYAAASRRKMVKSQTTHHRVDTTLRRADKEMSKAEMRRMLEEAARNTAKLPVEGETR